MKLSIIVPMYKVAAYVTRCIESVKIKKEKRKQAMSATKNCVFAPEKNLNEVLLHSVKVLSMF
jgi:hypothetical protein